MTLEILAFIFGALLTLIGIIGGGFEAKEIRIPKIVGIARFFSLIVGLSFIWLGFNLPINDDSTGEPPVTLNQRIDSERPVHFSIQDEMSAKDISDGYVGQSTVHINGRLVGTITVNPTFPKSSISVSMPNKGRYSYVVETKAYWYENGDVIRVYCIGDGQIDVDSGILYQITGRFDGHKCVLWLEQIL